MFDGWLLVAALTLTAPAVPALGRVFFGTPPQLADDLRLALHGEQLRHLADLRHQVSGRVGDVLTTLAKDVLGFGVTYSVVVATAYHMLVWLVAPAS